MDLEINFSDGSTGVLKHHGVLGQKWGIKNGPPYPLGKGKYSSSEKRKIFQARKKNPKGLYSKKQFTKALGGASASTQGQASKHDGLTDGQKKAVKIALASAAVIAVAGIGLYAANKAGLLDDGKAAVTQILSKQNLAVSKVDDLAVATHPFEESLPKINGTMSMDEHLSRANPLFGSFGSTDNCTRASTALELRLRGYDVEALPMEQGQTSIAIANAFGAKVHGGAFEKLTESEYKAIAKIAGDASLDETTRVSRLQKYLVAHPMTSAKIAIGSSSDGTKSFLRYVKKCPDGARGNLIGTTPSGLTHSMFWRNEGGKVVIYDGQSGEKYVNAVDKVLDLSNHQWFRTDNKQINWEIMQHQVKAHNPYYDALPTSRRYTYQSKGGYLVDVIPGFEQLTFPTPSSQGGFTNIEDAIRFAKAKDL